MSLSRRVARVEAQAQRQMIASIGREYGLTYPEFVAEAEAFFAMSLEAQLAEVDRIAGECQENLDDIKATLIREYRP